MITIITDDVWWRCWWKTILHYALDVWTERNVFAYSGSDWCWLKIEYFSLNFKYWFYFSFCSHLNSVRICVAKKFFWCGCVFVVSFTRRFLLLLRMLCPATILHLFQMHTPTPISHSKNDTKFNSKLSAHLTNWKWIKSKSKFHVKTNSILWYA